MQVHIYVHTSIGTCVYTQTYKGINHTHTHIKIRSQKKRRQKKIKMQAPIILIHFSSNLILGTHNKVFPYKKNTWAKGNGLSPVF